MRRTKRERAAMAKLLDAATEVVCVFGRPRTMVDVLTMLRTTPGPMDTCPVEALAALWDANDEWQEAQSEAAERPPSKPKKPRRRR